MSDWLELELAHRLAPVEAPDQLWDRICKAKTQQPARRPVWPIAAIVTVMMALGAMWMVAKGEQRPIDLARLAQLQLNAAGQLDLSSANPDTINAWAHQNAGVNLKIKPSSQVQLVGARIVQHGKDRLAAVSYRVNGKPAALLIARASIAGNTPHPGLAMAGFDSACAICHRSI